MVSRFVTEAKAVNQIGHEHIVDIADFGNTPDGEFYFVMEYLQGESLSDRLRRETRIDVDAALSISAQIADALNASHEQGIIHRDLKPENIFLCINRGPGRDFVKVLDFGLAKLTLSDQKVTHKTRTGSVMGTPYYMSPEQCEGKIEIDHRADIYSLGVLLFEMLTGKVPFGGDGYGEIIVKHVTMPPPSVRSVVPELPEVPGSDPVPRRWRRIAISASRPWRSCEEALRDPEALHQLGARDRHPGRPVGHRARRGADGAFGDGRALEDRLRLGAGRWNEPPGGTPSTFREGRGELIEQLHPEEANGQAFLFVRHRRLSSAPPWSLFGPRRERRRQPLPAAPRRAAPELGAHQLQLRSGRRDRARGDGKTLGLTPLSIEVPYSDSAVEFQFKKAGFENKTVYVVPNLPSPLFATLRKIEAPPPERRRRATTPLAPVGVHGVRIADAAEKPQQPAAEKQPLHSDDEDGVLEPSFGRPLISRSGRARRRRGCGRWLSPRRGVRRRA